MTFVGNILFRQEECLHLSDRISILMTYSCKICPEFGQELWLVDIVVILFYLLIMQDRQKATKIECKPGRKRDESTTVQNSQ